VNVFLNTLFVILLSAKLSQRYLTERNYSYSYKIVLIYEARIVKYVLIKYRIILWQGSSETKRVLRRFKPLRCGILTTPVPVR
jgi:hypothetical protein